MTSAVIGTGAGAGVDSAWEQEKPEARKMLVNRAESPASSARFVSPVFVIEDFHLFAPLITQTTTIIEIRSIESNAHLRNENGKEMDFESSIPIAIN